MMPDEIRKEVIKGLGPEREDFLQNLKTGDEVCVANFYSRNIATCTDYSLFGPIFPVFDKREEENFEERVIIAKVQGILDDGSIVVDNEVFDGKSAEKTGYGFIIAPTDKLRERATFLKNAYIICNIDWERVSLEAMDEIVSFINRLANDGRLLKSKEEKKKTE